MSEIFDNLLKPAYQSPPAVLPCARYRAPERFPHGVPIPVAIYQATGHQSLGSILFETRLPAASFTAILVDRMGEAHAVLGTGTDETVHSMLADLCEAFSEGRARLSKPAEFGAPAKQSARFARPYNDGQDVDVYHSWSNSAWKLVTVRPGTNGLGQPLAGLNLYLGDQVLAQRLADAFQEGQLRISDATSDPWTAGRPGPQNVADGQ